MGMNELIGKKCKMCVKIDNKFFYYTVKEVLSYDDPYITILDKFDKEVTLSRDTIVSIREIEAI